jgi:hypothetical protein
MSSLHSLFSGFTLLTILRSALPSRYTEACQVNDYLIAPSCQVNHYLIAPSWDYQRSAALGRTFPKQQGFPVDRPAVHNQSLHRTGYSFVPHFAFASL